MSPNATDPGALLMLATFGMEIVECGGAIAKHVRAGGTAYAAVAFSRPESRPQVEAATRILGITDVRFMDLDIGDVQSSAATKLPFVRLVREWKPQLVIMQDPVHAFGDLDPGRRDIMNLYLEALALAGRDWRLEECGGTAPHSVHTLYYMTPTTPPVSAMARICAAGMPVSPSAHSGVYGATWAASSSNPWV